LAEGYELPRSEAARDPYGDREQPRWSPLQNEAAPTAECLHISPWFSISQTLIDFTISPKHLFSHEACLAKPRALIVLGGLREGVVFSPKSDFLYVGNYFDSDLQVFRIQGETLKPAGANIKLGGQPASMRALSR